MIGWGNNTLRGGQTTFHGIRMWAQMFRIALFTAAAMIIAVPVWNIWRNTTGYEWYAAGMYTLVEGKLTIGFKGTSLQEIKDPYGVPHVFSLDYISNWNLGWSSREHLRDEIFSGPWLGAKLGVGLIAGFFIAFWILGSRLGRRKHIRGAELVTARQLRRRVQPLHTRFLQSVYPVAGLSPYRVAGVPYPERTETQHTIVSGTTGAGKTVLIADLVAQIRARGERCVIYDKMGSYTQSFFDHERDVLLNPLDDRSPRWSPFMEARNPRDFDMMAAALIPQQRDTVDPFWVTAARQLFSNGAAVLWKRGVTENRTLVDHLLKTELTALAQAMEGTVAQSIVDPENPKTALSVRAMLTAHIGALEFLPDTGKPFSIRDWVSRKDGGGFLFLTSRGDQHASLRGLISTWLEIAVNALLSLDQDGERRVWVILDELPTLHQAPSLQPGLAESRQFGGCFVLGIQVSSALRDLYGKNGAETISGLCGTRVVLSAPDRDPAQWSADSLGRAEIEEISEAYSYGANTMRDGVSLTPRRELRSLALPSEIMRLPNLTGYLKLPGPWPVARIKLKYVHRPMAAARFVPRGELPPVDGETAGISGRGADDKAPKPDAGSKGEPHEEDAMPWSAGTAGNHGKIHRAQLVDKSNGAGTAGNKVSLNLPPRGDAPGKDTGETNGEEKAETPVPAPDAGKAPLPGKKINLAAGDAEGSEDEARAGNGNGALSGQGKESTRSGHGDQGDGGSNGGEDRNRPPNWL